MNLREKCAIMSHFWIALSVYAGAMVILIITFVITSWGEGRPLDLPESSEYGLIKEPTIDYYKATIFGSSWLSSSLGAYCGILL